VSDGANKTLFRAPVPVDRKPPPAERRAGANSDVTRVRPAWVAAACAAAAIGVAWTVVPAGGAYGGPGPLTPPHVKAKLTCTSCHGKAEAGAPEYAKAAKKACVGCHGPHPSTRGPHAKLAADGVMGCTTCHTIHGPQSGVRLPDRGPAVRYGTWGETPVPELAFHSDRTVLVPTIPVKVCRGCHSDADSDPLARCRSHAGGGDLEPTVCFDEHRTALPATSAAAPSRDPFGKPKRPEPAKAADKNAVCGEQHFEDRSFAWSVAQEVATLTPPPKRAASSGSLAPLAWGGLAGALGYAGTAFAGALGRRRKRSAEAAAKPMPTAAADKRRLPFIYTDRCLGCYACVDACPYGVLEVEQYVAVVARPDACCGLVLCEQRCPNGSLVVTEGEDLVDRPRTTPSLESAEVPGLFLAGDVTGVPLIKNAILQGSRAAEAAVRSLPTRGAAPVDLCIVGAGPAGISAALRAKELGATAVVLEQGGVAQSIQSFPRGKLVFDQPLALPVAGKLTLAESTKEELLLHWMRIVRRERLDIREETRMVRVGRTEAGAFRVEAVGPDGAPVLVECRSVIVSIGTRGTPRRLHAPIETEAESRLYYHLADARSLAGQRIVVVGLGDSAMEAAIALSTQPSTSVTIVHRGATYSRGQPRNIAELERLRKVGRVRLLLSAEIDRVTRGDVVLRTPGSDRPERVPFDAVLVLIGSIPPWDTLANVGVHRAAPRIDPLPRPETSTTESP
jgi:thioredoxin reductase